MAAGSDLCVMPFSDIDVHPSSIKNSAAEESKNDKEANSNHSIKSNNKTNNIKDNNKQSIEINEEGLIPAEAIFIEEDEKVLVENTKFQDLLRNKGFGMVFNKEYIMDKLETLFLLQNNKLKLFNRDKEIDFSSFLKTFIKKDKQILTKYLVFRDLRSKGYVVKEGFGFGSDFRVYERGDYNKKTSKYVSIGLNEGTSIESGEFATMTEQIENMGKEAVIAVIERRGEVIYYKVSKMTFLENKKQV